MVIKNLSNTLATRQTLLNLSCTDLEVVLPAKAQRQKWRAAARPRWNVERSREFVGESHRGLAREHSHGLLLIRSLYIRVCVNIIGSLYIEMAALPVTGCH